MEGKPTGFVMQPLTQTDLVVSLSQMVKQKCPQVDLLVGIVEKNETKKVFEITVPLAAKLGQDLKDICCLFVHQSGSDKWRVLTTHGNVQILAAGKDFEVSICHNHQTPQETPILRQLTVLRNGLMSQSLGLPRVIDIPYSKIQGNVLLCGDFSIWNPISLLALREIFIVNGASSVVFVTPVIDSGRYRKLAQKGCNIVRLHPPEETQIGLIH